jgi:hypothetical protein
MRLLRVKNFYVGGMLASTLFVTSCAPAAEKEQTNQAETIDLEEYESDNEVRIKDQPFVFKQEFFDQLFRERTPDAINGNDFSGFYSYFTSVEDLKVESVEFVEDDVGPYARYKVALYEEYLDLIPMEYYDGTPITEFSKEEVQDAVRFYANYALNEYMDSPALDNPSQWNNWWETGGKDYFTPTAQDYILGIKQDYVHLKQNYEEDEDTYLGFYSIDETTPMVYVRWNTIVSPNRNPDDWNSNGYVVRQMRDGGSRVINKRIADLTFEPTEKNSLMIKGTVGGILRNDWDYFWGERDKFNDMRISEREQSWNDYLPEGQTWRDNFGTGKEILEPTTMYFYINLSKQNGEWKISGIGYNEGYQGESEYEIWDLLGPLDYSEDTLPELRYERFIE